MKLKTVQHTAATLFSLGIILAIVASELSDSMLFVFILIGFLAAEGVLIAIFWRCPHCKESLGRFGTVTDYCPHCGEKLDLD